MIKKGAGLDPLSLIIKSNLAISYRNRGELEAALTECRGMQALDPNFIYVNECFGSVYLELGRFDEAVAEYEKYSVSRVKRSSATADFGSALARAGRREEALVEVKRLTEMFDQGRANAVDVAQVYSALEENDKAFEWIEKALSRREGALPGIAGDHFFRFIRQDPRMETVLKRMGLGDGEDL
jgi:tetratricopeptide (TPR) repeat protein